MIHRAEDWREPCVGQEEEEVQMDELHEPAHLQPLIQVWWI